MDQGDQVNNVEKSTTTEAILNLLSGHSPDEKVALSLAALAMEFGEYWRLRRDITYFCPSLEILKFECGNIDPKKQQQKTAADVDELNNLIMLILEVTKSIFELDKLLRQLKVEVCWSLLGKLKDPYDQSHYSVVNILKLLISTENDEQLLHINDGSTLAVVCYI
ncbi:hypothetical protein FEM48_Zijuj11G0155600 [Ziziphus jujuba var. spinosa]|uniref:Sieve element occlusion N-terminal domain-containing protein n=1 Tax=Ziziphus jujuba var. spinosa TaxID=714518 RepID=A0A978UJS6_ZIZJJ|nr:hypothetical protein FEM48_Zijuj11G0155600 [Ziziphus jujuba var. spinosa]